MVDQTRLEELWEKAREDTGLGPGDVVLVPVNSIGARRQRCFFMPPGEAAGGMFDAGPDADAVDEVQADPRVVLNTSGLTDEPALLGLMRHGLELARVHRSAYQLYVFSFGVLHPALGAVYGRAGPGGAVMFNAIPVVRNANAAAAALVTRVFGPQVGRLWDREFGPLFRLEREVVPLEDLPRLSVVFAALWSDAVDERLLQISDDPVDVLRDLHASAPEWWEILRNDELFRNLSRAAVVFKPTPEEIEVAPLPGDAWRPLEGLADRASRYGLGVLQN